MSALDSVIEELELLLENAKDMESRCMGEVLALERMVNRGQKCIHSVQPKEPAREAQRKETQPPLSVQDKVDALMSDIEARQKIIEIEKYQTRPKIQTKLPEVVVEKKPPLPTVNRNERAIRNQIPAYVPPRNKNEVTGKVTQTTMRTSGQRVFRPEKTSLKKVETKEEIRTKGNMRDRTSVQKISEKKQVKIEVSTKTIDSGIKKEAEIINPPKEAKQQKQIQHKNALQKANQAKKGTNKVKFATFHKDIEQILSQVFKQGPKNHKFQLQKLLNDCQTQQKGHKLHQDNNRRIFIKKLNNYAVSRHAVYPMSSYEITRNKWHYHPELTDLHLLLDSLENELANFELQKDCRIDKKSQYRIAQSHLIYAQTIEAIRNDYEYSKEHVPEMLDLTFSFNEQQKQGDPNEQVEWENLSEVNLNSKLLDLLEDIASRGTLEKAELRGLQVISEIGMFRSKRSPLLVMEDEYLSWKKHYSDLNT